MLVSLLKCILALMYLFVLQRFFLTVPGVTCSLWCVIVAFPNCSHLFCICIRIRQNVNTN